MENSHTNASPIGVFDSGVGGLSVLKALREALPAERFIYAADSAYVPYGDRSNTLVLGCTHYVFLATAIHDLVGQSITVVESSAAVARQLRHSLAGRVNTGIELRSADQFLCTGEAERASRLYSSLLGDRIAVTGVDHEVDNQAQMESGYCGRT